MRGEEFIYWLKGARATGERKWVARCPAHEDKTPSLSIREIEDGMLLINCFGGCSPESVVTAMGLQMTDLFPREIVKSHGRPAPKLPTREVLELIDGEVLTAALLAIDFAEKGAIDDASRQRLITAARRIGKARDYVNGAG